MFRVSCGSKMEVFASIETALGYAIEQDDNSDIFTVEGVFVCSVCPNAEDKVRWSLSMKWMANSIVIQ